MKITIKQGDKVQVIAGSYKGEITEVLKVIRKSNSLILKNINIKNKHVKPKKEGEVGQIKQFEAPIHRSNVMLYDEVSQIRSRSKFIFSQDGKKVRVLKKLVKN